MTFWKKCHFNISLEQGYCTSDRIAMTGKLMMTIVNGIKPELINMKVGNRDFFIPLAAVENNCE